MKRPFVAIAKIFIHFAGNIVVKPVLLIRRKKALAGIPENPKILYVSLAYRGDLILAFPAIRALKTRFPKSFITVWVREFSAPLTDLSPYIDRTLTYDKFDSDGIRVLKELFPKNLHQGFLNKIRRASYDIYIDDSGYAFSSMLGIWANIPLRIGRNQQGFGYLNHYDYPYDFNGHLIKKKIDLLKPLGIISANSENDIPRIVIPKALTEKVLLKAQIDPLEARYFTCSPFAGWHSKNWDVEKFAYVVNEFAAYAKSIPVFIGGENDVDKISCISKLMKVPGKILIGELSLFDSAILISRANLHFGVDSIGSHLAAASGVKSLTIFGPTNPTRIAILTDINIAVLKRTKCTPPANKIYCCRDAGRSCADVSCMRELKQEDVLAVLKDLWDDKIKSKVIEF
jgi:heptosyltransferase II